MTEKRFNIKPSAIVDDVTVIIDDEKKYSFPILDSTLNYMFCKALNELNGLAEANEEQCLKIMTYLHDNYYDIWEEVNKECFSDEV